MYISCFLFSLFRRYRLDYFWMLELWKLPSSFFYWMNLHIANFVRIRVYHPVWKNEKYHNKRLQKISAVKYMYKMHNFLTLYEPEINISQFTFFTQIWHFLNWHFLHRLSACSPNLGPPQSMKNSFAPRESKCFVF